MTTLLWILVLIVAPLGMGIVLLYDRGVRNLERTLVEIAIRRGLNPVTFAKWFRLYRDRTPFIGRVMYSTLVGLMPPNPTTVLIVADILQKRPSVEVLLRHFMEEHGLVNETLESGEHDLPPVVVGVYEPDHEISKAKISAYGDKCHSGELQGIVVLFVTKDLKYSYSAHLNSYNEPSPITAEGFNALQQAALLFVEEVSLVEHDMRANEAERRAQK